MEGLIPFVYKAIVQYKNGKEAGTIGSWLCESPSYSYRRLPGGDSGRFQTSASLFQSDCGFSASSPSSNSPASATKIIVSSTVQSPIRRGLAA